MKFINHITVTTGHKRQSPRSEIEQKTLDEMVLWVKRILAGETFAIFYGEPYLLSCDAHNESMLIATLHTAESDMIRVGVCLNQDQASKTLQ